MARLLLRTRQPAEFLARGVFFGLLVGLTPSVGVQFPVIFLLWLAIRKVVPAWSFSLPVALTSSLVTNPLTAPLFYYLYVVTGRVLLGRWDRLRGFDTFRDRLRTALDPDASWLEAAWTYCVGIIAEFGIPLLVGSLPWALLGAWLGYRWSLSRIERHRARRDRRVRSASAGRRRA